MQTEHQASQRSKGNGDVAQGLPIGTRDLGDRYTCKFNVCKEIVGLMISLSSNCDRDRDRKLERHRNCNVRPSPGFECFVSAFGIGGEHWGVRKSISFTHRLISHSDSHVILRDAPASLYIPLNCSKIHNLLSVAFSFSLKTLVILPQ